MKILILNSGSSSVKFQLRNCENGEILAKGMAERVSTPNTMITFKTSKNKLEISKEANHEESIQVILKMMKDDTFGVIKSLDEIDAIGHRVVHGGEMYCKPMLIDDQVIDGIRKCNVLAPLHNPACLLGIHAARKLMPGKPNVAVFDTAFPVSYTHLTLPTKA